MSQNPRILFGIAAIATLFVMSGIVSAACATTAPQGYSKVYKNLTVSNITVVLNALNNPNNGSVCSAETYYTFYYNGKYTGVGTPWVGANTTVGPFVVGGYNVYLHPLSTYLSLTIGSSYVILNVTVLNAGSTIPTVSTSSTTVTTILYPPPTIILSKNSITFLRGNTTTIYLHINNGNAGEEAGPIFSNGIRIGFIQPTPDCSGCYWNYTVNISSTSNANLGTYAVDFYATRNGQNTYANLTVTVAQSLTPTTTIVTTLSTTLPTTVPVSTASTTVHTSTIPTSIATTIPQSNQTAGGGQSDIVSSIIKSITNFFSNLFKWL